ncbi:MAG: mechanosensitive ion channel domain-containing protein [Woeseia sp.]
MTSAAPRFRFRRFSALLFGTFLLLSGNGQLNAQQRTGEFDPITASTEIDGFVSRLDSNDIDTSFLDAARARAVTIAARATTCNLDATEARERLQARFDPLANIAATVEGSVFDQRTAILNQLNAAIERQTRCAGLRDDASALVDRITETQTGLSQRFLFNRSDSMFGMARSLPDRVSLWPRNLSKAVDLQLAKGVTVGTLLWLLLGAGLLAAAAGLYVRYQFRRWFKAGGGSAAEPRLKFLFPKPLAQYAPLLLEGLALLVVLLLCLENASLDLVVVRLAAGILLFGFGCTLIDWATGPISPSANIKGLVPDHVRPLRWRLRFFVLMLVASFVVLGTNWLSIRLLDPSVGGRATMIFLVAFSLLVVLAYLRNIPGLRHRFRLVRYSGVLALTTGIFAIMLGYQNLAGYLIHGATRTALALVILWILLWLVYQAFEFLVQPESSAATRLRRSLGVRKSSSRSGIGFLQLVADLIVWLVFVVYLIYVWDESGTTLDRLVELVTIGGTVGNIRLVPLNIIGGILVFAGVIVLIGWIKRWIDVRWLQHIVTERGAREALVTLIGYIGFVVAVIIGLIQAGVDLGGLAIVSGALALGIGFGMQEIANNFVSGLILLFERPIRAGDFVTVGNVEGFIRRIRIRATEIETLDNQNVLVPNSELVSGQVTNWVLRDPQGRLLIRVGVAYGSDVQKVKEILQRVGSEHPEVITDGRAPAPRALFMGFGDSSLDFELRVRVQRIERRFSVLSDINFAIDAAFREENITIPFPQRDLHLVSYPKAEVKEKPPERKSLDETIRTRIIHDPEHVTRSHREDVRIAVGADDLWAAITDISSMKKWLVNDGEFRPFIGGPFKLQLQDETEMSGRIDIFMPPRRMRLVIAPRENENPLASGPITIDFILKQDDGKEKTELTVIIAGIPASEDWEMDFRRTEDRWHTALEELKEYLAPK